MKTRAPIVEIVFALLGVAFLALFGGGEREASNVDCCSSYQARGDGYRAWYELLQREGMRVMRFERHWAFLDESVATLVLAVPPGASSSGKTPTGPSALALWVKNGGRLLELLPSDQAGKGERLFSKRDASGLRYHALSRGGLRIKGVNAARMGRGEILRVEDADAFDNAHIGRGDTARTAYFLAISARAGAVAFEETVHGHIVPEHWWEFAPRRMVFAVVGACVVLVIALSGAAIRLGPPVLPSERREATSVEYLDAVASLYRQANAKRKVVQDAANALRRAGREEDVSLRAALAELDATAAAPTISDGAFLRVTAMVYQRREKRS